MILRALLAATILIAGTESLAGASTYQCQISEQLHLDAAGELKRPANPWLIRSRFSVDRDTGVLVGPDKSFWSFKDSRSTVLARGNAKTSFVALIMSAAADNGVLATTLVIEEFAKGQVKPFIVNTGTQVASGMCE